MQGATLCSVHHYVSTHSFALSDCSGIAVCSREIQLLRASSVNIVRSCKVAPSMAQTAKYILAIRPKSLWWQNFTYNIVLQQKQRDLLAVQIVQKPGNVLVHAVVRAQVFGVDQNLAPVDHSLLAVLVLLCADVDQRGEN